MSEILMGVAMLLAVVVMALVREKRFAPALEERKRLDDLVDRPASDSGIVSRADLVKKVRGKYAHLGMSSEAFAAQKQEEIRLEDRG